MGSSPIASIQTAGKPAIVQVSRLFCTLFILHAEKVLSSGVAESVCWKTAERTPGQTAAPAVPQVLRAQEVLSFPLSPSSPGGAEGVLTSCSERMTDFLVVSRRSLPGTVGS